MAAEEPRTGAKMNQKKELAKKALEQAFQGKEKEFAKLDDQGNDGNVSGNGSDRGGGGGGGGGGNNEEDWGEVFQLAVKIVMYLLLGIVFVILWPKLFDGATSVYNKVTGKEEVVQSKPVKEDFDDEDFDELARGSTPTTMTTTAAKTETETKPTKRAFPEREAFDTWQFGSAKGQDNADELMEKEIQAETLKEEMLNPTFHDQFQAKPRSKHIVLKDTKTMDKAGPYQDHVTGKWK
jgi:hypothetical protein